MATDSEAKLLVAVDFGTTFSGVAFVYTDAPESIEVICEWPSGGNRTSDKVPTEICYDNRGGYKWGFDIKPEQKRHQWFKLQLDPSQRSRAKPSSLARNYPSKTELPPDYARDTTEFVTDYLTALRKHAMEKLVARYGKETGFLEDTPIEYILTIPAVWSDRARNKTLESARKAGMSRISCISEPEAAAVYTLKVIQPNSLRLNDNFVVCDAGGGTVDLITYKVTQLDPLKVEESVVGDGGLCGSTYLNRRFEEFLENKIGADVMENLRPRAKSMMMKEFDEFIKRDFCDLPQQYEYIVGAPGIKGTDTNSVQDGLLSISRAEVRKIFEPVISEVQDLVLDQVRNVEKKRGRVAAVLLVGGFGASNYLRKRLEACVGAEVMQPVNAWTAVVRGALLRGLEGPLISHRQARRHYGVIFTSKFIPGFHPKSNRFWDSFDGYHRCDNLMHWYLKKGEKVADTKSVSFRWVMNMGLSSSMESQEIDIYCYEGDEIDDVPTYKTPDTFCVCTLDADFTGIPRSRFQRKSSATPGDPDQYVFKYDLEMTVGSASISFRMTIGGEECGTVDTKFV